LTKQYEPWNCERVRKRFVTAAQLFTACRVLAASTQTKTMKTLLSLIIIAVPAVFVLAPLSGEIATSLLFAIGFVGLALYDYTHAIHPRAAAPAVRGAVRRHRERLGLIA
jgi:FtsH-binding integral membrane protein